VKRKARILLVDDDADFVASTKTVLESKPYNVIVAVNGNEGLRKAREEKPDLILLDIIMPVEDGFTAAEQLKKDPQLTNIPVLMLTSYSTKGSGTGIPRSRGYTLDAEDYIEKPISEVTPADIFAFIESQRKRTRPRRLGGKRADPDSGLSTIQFLRCFFVFSVSLLPKMCFSAV